MNWIISSLNYKQFHQNYYNSNLPKFLELELSDPNTKGEFFIEKLNNNIYRLFDLEGGVELLTSPSPLILPFIRIDFDWSNSKYKDRIYFKIENIEATLKYLRNNLSINKEGKSDIFKLSVTFESPYIAQLIANTIADKYREVRLEQKRQTTHNSFQFVDIQLQEVSDKLKDAEIALSNFKSENKIAIMDESSKDLIESLSSLEGEKIKTDLELAQYQNKVRELNKEFKKKGYFDQTFLTPVESSSERSPFSILLEQLTDAEIKRLELLQRRKESHPDVVTLDEQITKIKQKLADYNQNTLTSYNILIKTLRRKRYDLIRLIEKYSSKIEKLPDQETVLVELMRAKNVHEKMFTLLLDKREELRMAEFSKLQDIVIVDSAQLAFKPISPRKILNIGLGIIFGFIVGLVGMVLQEFFEKRITTVEEIEHKYSYPVLAVIPQYSKQIQKRIRQAQKAEDRLVNLMENQEIFNESYRVVRTKLFNCSDKNIKTLLFTSCEEDTGKTSVVTNLATSFAIGGKKVLVLDCDLRKPAISKFFDGSENQPGLIQVLSDKNKSSVRKFFKIKKNGNYKVDYIPSGGVSEKSSELLESPKMRELIDHYSSKYDYIFIDTPPITRTADALVLSKYVKQILLIVKPYHTFKGSVALGIEELEQAGMKILGLIPIL